MVLFTPGHKEFAQHVGVQYLLGEKPKSTLLTMKCCVIELCLLTTGKKSISGWSVRVFFNGTKGHTRQRFSFGNRRGGLVRVLLLMLCFDPAMGDRGEWAHGATPLWPVWALVTRLKLALGRAYIYAHVYILHSCHFSGGGVDLTCETRQWQPRVNHAVSQELK